MESKEVSLFFYTIKNDSINKYHFEQHWVEN